VILDALTSAIVRRRNRQVLKFPPSHEQPRLPQPDPEVNYLLYLHVPYCVVLCPFCSFHRVRFKPDKGAEYFACLRREIEIVTDAGYRFDELYVGGGTPTVMPQELTLTVNLVRRLHALNAVSVETNPDDLEKEGVQHLRDAGVNRLSVGVQSFDDDLLREMERFEKYGSGAEIIRRLRRQRGTFDTLNIDMIFNLPHQTEASLRRDLDILVEEIGADQVSYYPLMAASSTREMMRRSMGRVNHANERRYYGIIVERLLRAGYTRNSAWCFARQAGLFDEYIVDHEQYVGLGSGAFSYLGGSVYASTFSLNHYVRLVAAGVTATAQHRSMSAKDQMRYYLLMQLFTGSLDVSAAEDRFAGRFRRTLWFELMALRLIGALRDEDAYLVLTERGYYLWVTMMREFFTGVGSLRDDMRHHISEESTVLADFGKPQ